MSVRVGALRVLRLKVLPVESLLQRIHPSSTTGVPATSTGSHSHNALVHLKDRVVGSYQQLEGMVQPKGRPAVYLMRRSVVEDLLQNAAGTATSESAPALEDGHTHATSPTHSSLSSPMPQPEQQLALLANPGFSISLQGLLATKEDVARPSINPPATALTQTIKGLDLAATTAPLPHVLDAFDTVQQGDVPRLQSLLVAHPDLLQARHPNHGGGLLHVAAASSVAAEEVVGLLLNQGVDVNALSDNGASPLHWAAGHGRRDVAELLLKHNADAHLSSYTWGRQIFGKDSGQTPGHWAAQSGHTDVLELLAEYAPLAFIEKDERGKTPLAVAAGELRHEAEAFLMSVMGDEFVAVEVQHEGQAFRVLRESKGGQAKKEERKRKKK